MRISHWENTRGDKLPLSHLNKEINLRPKELLMVVILKKATTSITYVL